MVYVWHHPPTVPHGHALLYAAVDELLVGSIVGCCPKVGWSEDLLVTHSDFILHELPPSRPLIRAHMTVELHHKLGLAWTS